MASTATIRRTSLSILFLFFALSLYNFNFRPKNEPRHSHTHNYIVRFLQYGNAVHHRAYLESNLPSQGWRWIDRRNTAANYPTDLGLVSVEDSVKEELTRKIRSLALVKDVHVDIGYKRDLLHQSGVFLDGTKNRPGKIFTPMSFNEAHCEPIANSSLQLGRQLFMQRSQITSMFGARGSLGERIHWCKSQNDADAKFIINWRRVAVTSMFGFGFVGPVGHF